MWLLLVGDRLQRDRARRGASSYQAFVFPGLVVMAALFGGMLTAISTVYDREFGMLRLMLASPAGVPDVLAGRAIAATAIGVIAGRRRARCSLRCSSPMTAARLALAAALALLAARGRQQRPRPARRGAAAVGRELRRHHQRRAVSAAVPERRAVSDGRMPPALRLLAQLNPVTYAVDLMRGALGQPTEFGAPLSLIVLAASTMIAFGLAAPLFDPERRISMRKK